MTNIEKMREIFPKARLEGCNGLIECCPMALGKACNKCEVESCIECCYKFWSSEYKK